MSEQVKVEFGEAGGISDSMAQAMASFDYVARKLWVRVDELDAGTDPKAVGGFILKDSEALKIQEFKDDGFRELDRWIRWMTGMVNTVEKDRGRLAASFTVLDNAAKDATMGKLGSKTFRAALIKFTKDIESTMGAIEKSSAVK